MATVFARRNKTYGSPRGHDVITWGWHRTDLLGWVVGLLKHLGDVTQLSPEPPLREAALASQGDISSASLELRRLFLPRENTAQLSGSPPP